MSEEYRNHRTAWALGELTFVETHDRKILTTEIATHLGRTYPDRNKIGSPGVRAL